MNIHYFQHVPFEGLGSIENWTYRPGNRVTATRFYEDHRLPFIDLFDFLIIMGGPMGALDDQKYPWMVQEKKLIEKAIEKNKAVLGICLGAQLIADVLGAKVYPNKEKEIGWFPIQLTEEGKKSTFFAQCPSDLDVLHWHGDTFDLPKNAVHLAKSEACENQAFSYQESVLGLQFHFEATPASVVELIKGAESDLVQGKFIQTRNQILNVDPENYRGNNIILRNILNQLIQSKNKNQSSDANNIK